MVTTADILSATGLKASKTLTRWHQRGVIPAPTVGLHPSGRGKTSYWPDWVLDRCVRLVELQRSGKSLEEAAVAIEMERLEKILDAANEAPLGLDDIPVRVGEREVSLGDLVALEVAQATADAMPGLVSVQALVKSLRSARAGDTALALLSGGYNPVAIVGDGQPEVVPDFVVSHRLAAGASPFVVVGLLAPLRAVFTKLGRELPVAPSAIPAPAIWVSESGGRVEYAIYPGGPAGFELIRESARAVPDLQGGEH